MMKLRNKALALALSAAILGGGASLAQAQAISPGSLGQVLIYPYLTAKGNWSSFLHVINTSNTQTVAAKVRFRTAADSADAYDFIVVLSPSDVWTGVVEQQGGLYGFRPTDNTCTVPNFGKDVFTPFIVQSAEVYAEVIMMGVSTATATGSVGANAKHNPTTGIPANCTNVQSAFANPGAVALLNTAPNDFGAAGNLLALPATNVLTGKYDLVNVTLGQSGAGRAVVISGFGAAPGGSVIAGTNLYSQSQFDWDHPTLAEGLTGLTPFNAVLNKTALINEWVLNPNLGELSSWVVTFPTKSLTVNAIAAANALPAQAAAGLLPTFGTLPNGTLPVGNAVNPNCVLGIPAIYNREEKELVGASPGTSPLCFEANVISFRNASANSSSVLDSSVGVTVDTTLLGATGVQAGWMRLGMPATSVQHTFNPAWTTLPGWAPAAATVPGGAATVGRPAVGFNLTARRSPADTVLYDHAYQ